MRCRQRSIQCQYPTQRRSKAKDNSGVAGSPAGLNAGENVLTDISDGIRMQVSETEGSRRQSLPQGIPRSQPPSQFHTISFQTRDEEIISPTRKVSSNLQPEMSGSQISPSSTFSPSSSRRLSGYDIGSPNMLHRPNAPNISMHRTQNYQGPSKNQIPSVTPQMTSAILHSPLSNGPGLGTGSVRSPQANKISLGNDLSPLSRPVLTGGHWLPTDFFRVMHKEQNIHGVASHTSPGSYREVGTPATPQAAENIAKTNQITRRSWSDFALSNRLSGPENRNIQVTDPVPGILTGGDLPFNEQRIHGTGTDLSRYEYQQAALQTSSMLPPELSIRGGTEKPGSRFYFPIANITEPKSLSDRKLHIPLIDRSTYGKLHDSFRRTCQSHDSLFRPFDSDAFPGSHILDSFIQSYFRFFHRVYPIVHQPTFDPNRCHYLLTLAVAALGCHTANMFETDNYAKAFHEFIRRVILVEVRVS